MRSLSPVRTWFLFALLGAATVLLACGQTPEDRDDSGVERQLLAASTSLARISHTATLLTDGTVLLSGGATDTRAELISQDGTTSSYTGAPLTNRSSHTATLLQNGKVLLVGGLNQNSWAYLSSTELYDPATKTFSYGPSLSTARMGHTATLLTDGTVLICGGQSAASSYLYTCESYSPSSNTLQPVSGVMVYARANHTAVLLSSGKALVCGGKNSAGDLNYCELYTPSSNSWASTPNMSSARSSHAATMLNSGKVLITGGKSGTSALATTEIYNPTTNSFSAGPAMSVARYAHSATFTPEGRVAVAGGYNGTTVQNKVETYDYHYNVWTAGTALTAARYKHTASMLYDGRILVLGGANASGAGETSMEILTLATCGGTTTTYVTSGTQASCYYSPRGSMSSADTWMLVGSTTDYDNFDAYFLMSFTLSGTLPIDVSKATIAFATGDSVSTSSSYSKANIAQVTSSWSTTTACNAASYAAASQTAFPTGECTGNCSRQEYEITTIYNNWKNGDSNYGLKVWPKSRLSKESFLDMR